MQPKIPETRLDQFLLLTAMSGEMPKRMEHFLAGGYEYNRKCIARARKQGFVRVFVKDKLRGYRLTGKGREYLLQKYPDQASLFLDGTVIPVDLPRRERLHRSSEAYHFMRNSGVAIFCQSKPPLFSTSVLEEEIAEPAYYSAKEIKGYGVECLRIRNSRSVGILVLPQEFYVVYNTGHQQMAWSENAEERMSALMETLLQDTGAFPPSVAPQAGAILLADSMGGFLPFISSPAEKGALPLNGGGYPKMLWLPNSEEGQIIIKLLCDEAKRQSLDKSILANFPDGKDEEDHPVCIAYDGDIAKVHSFLRSMKARRTQGVLVCFDFQREVMEALCGQLAKVMTVSLADGREMLGI